MNELPTRSLRPIPAVLGPRLAACGRSRSGRSKWWLSLSAQKAMTVQRHKLELETCSTGLDRPGSRCSSSAPGVPARISALGPTAILPCSIRQSPILWGLSADLAMAVPCRKLIKQSFRTGPNQPGSRCSSTAPGVSARIPALRASASPLYPIELGQSAHRLEGARQRWRHQLIAELIGQFSPIGR